MSVFHLLTELKDEKLTFRNGEARFLVKKRYIRRSNLNNIFVVKIGSEQELKILKHLVIDRKFRGQ